MTMNFSEMQAEVRVRIDEATANFWSDADIQDSLNEGYMEISDATEWYERKANVPMWKNRTYFDMRELLPDTYLAAKRCQNNTTDHWLVPTTIRAQDKIYAQWERTSGEPEYFFTRGIYWIGFYPKPDDDNGSARLYYSALPPAMSSDTDEPQIPEEYHMGIVAYAVYDLLAQDAETQKALQWFAEYQMYESNLNEYVSGRLKKDKVNIVGNRS